MSYEFDVRRVNGVITITVDDLGAERISAALVLEGWEALAEGNRSAVDFSIQLGEAIDEYLPNEDLPEEA